MAEATVTSPHQRSVMGDVAAYGADSIVFAANSDVWTTPLKHIYAINLTPTTNTAFGFTVSAGVITLVAASGLTFRGEVIGK